MEEHRRALAERAEAAPPGWSWPERLAIAGLGALLLSPVLPWATDPAGDPLWLGQAGLPNGLLAAIVTASVVVPVQVTAGHRREGFPYLVALTGTVAVIGALFVRDIGDDGARQPFVPGRIAAVLGGVAIVAAAFGMGRAWADRKAALAPLSRLGRGKRPFVDRPERPSDAVDRAVTTWPTAPSGTGWVSPALVLVGAGAAALAGPWWQGIRVAGPYEVPNASDPMLDGGESARTVRSGIEVLGAARSWAVAGAVLVAIVAVTWLGGRRRAQVVVACGAFALGIVVASLPGPDAGGAAVPGLTAVVVALGVTVAGVALLRLWSTDALWIVPPLVAMPGLLAATWSTMVEDLPGPEMDGPYRVLVDAPPEYGGTGSFDGAPAADVLGESLAPVWVHGLPGAVGVTTPADGDGLLALWVVQDGRVEVRSIVTDDDYTMSHPYPITFEVTDDGTVLAWTIENDEYGASRSVIMPLGRGGGSWFLPQGTDDATFGPRGEVWMRGVDHDDATWPPGAIYEATVDSLARPGMGSTRIDEWQETSANVGGELAADGSTVISPGPDGIVAVGPDGTRRTVLGGGPDQTCGLTRQATSSYIDEDWSQVDDPNAMPWTTSPNQRIAPAPDGGIWAALPTPDPNDGRYVLGKADPDGTLRLVDHELPSIGGIVLSPSGDTVVVADTRGRLLELPNAEAALEPAPPPPDGCYTEEPEVAPPAQITEIRAPTEGTLLDAAGTRLVADAEGGSFDAPRLTRVAPDGTETVVADGTLGPLYGDFVPDGAGGAWWLETTEELSEDEVLTTSFDARPVHLLASGAVERSPVTLPVGPGPEATGLRADGDVAYVRGAHRIWRIDGDDADVLHEGPGVREINGRTDRFVVTRSGEVIVQLDDDHTALLHVVDGHLRQFVGDVPDPPPDDGTPLDRERDDPPYRQLSVELDAGTPPDQIHVRGSIVEDPGGDGVLLLQDGLLVRITTDGRVIPLAQDEGLEVDEEADNQLVVLGGKVVVNQSIAVEVPG